MGPTFPEISINLRGVSGSMVVLRWRMLNALEEAGVAPHWIKEIHREALICHTYEELLDFVKEKVYVK